MNSAEITDASFRAAVEAIDCGDVVVLRELLEADASLVVRRLDRPAEGYFARPYLLWFVAENPIRHEKLPANIVEVAEVILLALRAGGDPGYSFIVDNTMGLVCTGRIPKECGVQIPLMELLVRYGAAVKGSVLGAIGQRNFEAARWLLAHGSSYDPGTAVGLDDVEGAARLAGEATASQLYVALVVAAFFGKAEMIRLLLGAGVDVNGSGTSEDFGGFHSHASALHQAVHSGSIEAVRLLVEAGADRFAKDSVYGGTPIGWARYMREEAVGVEEKGRFGEIEGFLGQEVG
ncbi:MAG TPA: ankyrin repeat domain-containing protein [Puia sp.]|uniref:ankyrin repeat domain-containing protein n=1 Tax=Puia sp. TaxID=2045100 RepID=UPI002B9779A9|nr:ankyrin repeat domain-containing protein [Puia sp.]HVU94874.1 ankyrin repeat domain-containing protein [Puia sp.]